MSRNNQVKGKKVSIKDDVPWVEKYRPKRLKEVIGVESKKKKLLEFLKSFPEKRAAVLLGPPGVGKTQPTKYPHRINMFAGRKGDCN